MFNRYLLDDDFAAMETAGNRKINSDARAFLNHACMLYLEDQARAENARLSATEVRSEITAMKEAATLVLRHVKRLNKADIMTIFEGHDQISLAFIDTCNDGRFNKVQGRFDNVELREMRRLLLKYTRVVCIMTRDVDSDLPKRGRPKTIPKQFVIDMAYIYRLIGGDPSANNPGDGGKPDGPFIRFVLEAARRGLRLSEKQLRSWPDAIRNFNRHHDGLSPQAYHSFRGRRTKIRASRQ